MAKIAGVQAFSFGQSASLCVDGKLVAFIEDEKISRVKDENWNFPAASLKYCLSEAKLAIDDVDEVAVPWVPHVLFATAAKHAVLGALKAPFERGRGVAADADAISLFYDRFIIMIRHLPLFMRNLLRHHLRFTMRGRRLPKIVFVPHHLSHAASTFYLSGLDEAAIVIVDGLGDSESATIWHGRGLDLKRLEKVNFPNSLGEYYSAFTQYLGFQPYSQEGKLMGLAAYGEADADIARKIASVLRVDGEGYRLDAAYTIGGRHTFGTYYSDALVQLLGTPRPPNAEFTPYHKNVAFAVQDALERAVAVLVRRAVRLTGCRNVCMAGGVAMNCKMNGVVLALPAVDRLFVLPAAGDAGAALGASFVRSVAHGHDPRFTLEHPYFGPGFSDDEIRKELEQFGLPLNELDLNDLQTVVDDLVRGDVLGLFTGRMEFGARALGARSILANPAIPGMRDRVNAKVKFRESWRPFAPVVPKGMEAELFEGGEVSRYMMKAFRANARTKEIAPDIVHVDGTVRPQSADRETNPVYWSILDGFRRKTGIPILLNTSFNLRNEPIVCTPRDAVRTFFSSGMDHLLIGRFYLNKRGA